MAITVVELKQICKDNGIVCYSKLKKEELLKLCKDKKTTIKKSSKKSSNGTMWKWIQKSKWNIDNNTERIRKLYKKI